MVTNRTNPWWIVGMGTILCCLVALGAGTLMADTIAAEEGQPAAFNVTVTNGRGVPITITSLAALPPDNLDSFERDDKVTGVFANDGCTGKTIPSGGKCTFVVTITTGDASGQNDNDVGTWRVGAKVFASFIDPATGRPDFPHAQSVPASLFRAASPYNSSGFGSISIGPSRPFADEMTLNSDMCSRASFRAGDSSFFGAASSDRTTIVSESITANATGIRRQHDMPGFLRLILRVA